MDQFSSDKLNDIAALYESIHYGTSEAEVLNERGGGIGAGIAAQQARQQRAQVQGTRTALNTGKSIGLAGNNAGQNVGSLKLDSGATKKSGRSTLTITPDKDTTPNMNKDAVYGNKRTIGGDTYHRAKLKGKDVFVSGNKVAPKPAPTPVAPKPAPTPAATTPATTPAPATTPRGAGARPPAVGARPPAVGAPGGKVIPTKPAGAPAGAPVAARRAATGDELRAAQAARQSALASNPNDKKGAEQAAVSAGVQRSLPTTGPTRPAPAGASSVAADVAKANSPSVMNRPAPAGSALARAQRPATTAQATAAAPSASPAASGSVVPATNAAAAAPRPKPMVPARAPAGAPLRPEPLFQSYNYEDVYDLVLEYLITEGYADTNESALAIMANMSEEWRENICEISGMGGEVHPTKNVYTGRLNPHHSEYSLQSGRSKTKSGESPKRNRDPGNATGLALSPVKRAELRSKALRSRGDSASNKRANKIDKFVKSSENENIARITAYSDGKRDGKNYMRNANKP